MVKQHSDEDPIRPGPLLTSAEAARRLHISRSYLYELISMGVLQVVHIGGVRRFRPEDVEALIGRPLTERKKTTRPPKKGAS